jgi:hypothetical protein
MAAVLMPTTSPRVDTSGPPELWQDNLLLHRTGATRIHSGYVG